MISEVQAIFNNRIKHKFGLKEDIFRYLYRHERKDICIGKICEQIREIERRLYSITFNAEVYRGLIENMADFFCLQALTYAEEKALSQAERQRRLDESAYYETIGEEIKEIETEENKRAETPTSFLNDTAQSD